MESAAPPTAFPTVAGHTIIREIGGGMARVFLARDDSLGREVVVKVLSADMAEELSAERFVREVNLVAVLQEPHILPALPSVRVAGRTSSYSSKGKHPTAQEVGKALNVTGVIDGSVTRSSGRLRISIASHR